MAENQMTVENEVQLEKPSEEPKKESFGAKVKERLRRFAVKLKRKPQMIVLLFVLITSVVYLLGLRSFSKAVYAFPTSNLPDTVFGSEIINFMGICVFINTLFSFLVLMLVLWSFPKRKKPNVVMLVLSFVFMAVLIVFDILYYVQIYGLCADQIGSTLRADVMYYLTNQNKTAGSYIISSFNYTWAHVALTGLSIVLLATLPLYKKLLMKINTKKVIESTEIKGEIDTNAEV